jgi:glycerol-3-phosphate O-acyltransferase/dihydroxyacetone phosphate acyltransferase
LVGMFDQGGTVKRDACGKLLELIHDGLKAVTIRTPDFETLMVSSFDLAFIMSNPA